MGSEWVPSEDFLIIEPRNLGEKSEGGLYIPDASQQTGIAKVISVHDGVLYDVGDDVLYLSNTPIQHDALPKGQALLHRENVLAYRSTK